MPRRIQMIELQDIIYRLRNGQSIKSIHRETGHHKTVIRALKQIMIENNWMDPNDCIPTEKQIQLVYLQKEQLNKKHPLDTLKDDIKYWLDEKNSYHVIHQMIYKRIPCSESTVRRYIQKNFPLTLESVMSRTHIPGEIMEVDFGYIGLCWDDRTQRNRKTWFFSARFRYSRKTYREIVFSQQAMTFFACHIHAFEYFSGIPEKVVPDNLKAAVIRASFTNPLINRVYRDLAMHYGFTISPTIPYSGKHKGGVESDVKYVKRNFLPQFKEEQRQKGREKLDAGDMIRSLWKWNDNIADMRTIQKVGYTPVELFEEEKKHLKSLPDERWDIVTCKLATVSREWRVQFENAFYSVPYKYIGKEVTVMGNSKLVRIFYDYEEITVHERAQKQWSFKRKSEHAPPNKEEYLNMTSKGLRKKAEMTGLSVLKVAEKIFEDRAIDGLRPVRGLLRLAEQYSPERLEKACRRALEFETASYQSVKSILQKNMDNMEQEQNQEPSGQYQFRFQREPGYFDPVREGGEKS